jgi:hypothetical protein
MLAAGPWLSDMHGELLWGPAHSCRVAPSHFHFRLPTKAQFLTSLHMHVLGPGLLLQAMKRLAGLPGEQLLTVY